jgi:hypothetical protein
MEYAKKCIEANKHNHVTTTYYLLLQKHLRNGGKSSADLSNPSFYTRNSSIPNNPSIHSTPPAHATHGSGTSNYNSANATNTSTAPTVTANAKTPTKNSNNSDAIGENIPDAPNQARRNTIEVAVNLSASSSIPVANPPAQR